MECAGKQSARALYVRQTLVCRSDLSECKSYDKLKFVGQPDVND